MPERKGSPCHLIYNNYYNINFKFFEQTVRTICKKSVRNEKTLLKISFKVQFPYFQYGKWGWTIKQLGINLQSEIHKPIWKFKPEFPKDKNLNLRLKMSEYHYSSNNSFLRQLFKTKPMLKLLFVQLQSISKRLSLIFCHKKN
jgi:hypothetical protein